MPEDFLLRAVKVILLLAFCAFFLASCSSGDNGYVTVMLTQSEYLNIISENPVRVRIGEDAVFEVELKNGYKFDDLGSGAKYENGRVVLEDVKYPATLNGATRKKNTYIYEYAGLSEYGNVSSSIMSGIVAEDTVITLTAQPAEDGIFLGYSLDKALSDGGEIVEYDTVYTFPVTDNVNVIPNFASVHTKLLKYQLNGGECNGAAIDTVTVSSDDSLYILPNSQICDGKFTRDGYALLGYTTQPDGGRDPITGRDASSANRFYGCGWNVVIGDGETEDLYCLWAKYSPAEDFEYTLKNGSVAINKYTGADAFVVIPEYIDGSPVTEITKDAFTSDAVEEVYITRNITTMRANAFNGCANLKRIYICDSLIAAGDMCITDCPQLSQMYINATYYPSMSYMLMGTGAIKFERLMTAQSPKVMLISGSSSLFGFYGERFEELTGGKYQVINYGTHANTIATFYIEVCSRFTNPGDYLIAAPEMFIDQLGSNVVNNILWQVFEGALEAFSYVDIRNYSNIISTFSAFNKSRQYMEAQSYEIGYNDFTKYGDYWSERPKQRSETYVTFGNGVLEYDLNLFRAKEIAQLNKAFNMIKEAGGKVYLSFAPTNVNGLSKRSQTEAAQRAYMDKIDELLDATRISEISTYLFTGQYFWDTDYHCGNEGALMRTERLAADFLAQIEKEEGERQ
jgi:hypothetical protein